MLLKLTCLKQLAIEIAYTRNLTICDYCYSRCVDYDLDVCTYNMAACVKPGGQGEFMHAYAIVFI